MKFIIVGKIIPYTRMTRRSKYVDERAQRYLRSKAIIGWQLKQQMRYAGAEMINRQTRLAVTIQMRASGGLHRWDKVATEVIWLSPAVTERGQLMLSI